MTLRRPCGSAACQALRREARRRRPRPDVDAARSSPAGPERRREDDDRGDPRGLPRRATAARCGVLGGTRSDGDRAWRARLGIVLQSSNDQRRADGRRAGPALRAVLPATRATPTR